MISLYDFLIVDIGMNKNGTISTDQPGNMKQIGTEHTCQRFHVLHAVFSQRYEDIIHLVSGTNGVS